MGFCFVTCLSTWQCGGGLSSSLALMAAGPMLLCLALGSLQRHGSSCSDHRLGCPGLCNLFSMTFWLSLDQMQVTADFGMHTSRILPRGCSSSWFVARFRWMVCLILMNGFRIGEALVPGPSFLASDDTLEWSIGVANPAGLPNKAHIFSQSSVDLWCVSETHLSKQGARTFMKQLQFEKSDYKWCVSGWPVPPRSNVSLHGGWSGVAAISKHPTRALPETWGPAVAQSSRIVASTTMIHDIWISGVTCYGVPIGPTHPQARAATSQILEAAVDRLQCMEGPRFLAGDLNHDVASLPVLQRLESLHFVEVQNLWQERTGLPPQATCKHKTQRDYLFLSPELASLLVSVRIDPYVWADHATIEATFRGGSASLRRFPWPCPQPLPWSQVGPDLVPDVQSLSVSDDCTVAYQELWKAVESRVSDAFAQQDRKLPTQCFGRGQRLSRHTVVGCHAPTKKGRQGEFQPRFFGLSYLYAHRLKQVRRLQSFVRLNDVKALSSQHQEHRVALWQAICRAPGFSPDFATWWSHRPLVLGDPSEIPQFPPNQHVATALLLAMQLEVRNLEARLLRGQCSRKAKCRSSGLSKLYASVRRDAPVPVDVLVESKQGIISDVDVDLCALELRSPVTFDPGRPIMCNGNEISPVVLTEDKLFVENTHGIQPGDLICQTKTTGKLEDVFDAFTTQWQQRWDKHAGFQASHWESIFQFAAARIGRVDVPPPFFSPELVRSIAHGKKSKAAIGLDGVSRQDVLHLNEPEMQAVVGIYARAHSDGSWPSQLLQGQVKSLAKKERPAGVGDFRPITIFSFLYRIWSSISSQHWLKHVSPILDSRLCGNRGGYRASYLWRAVLDDVEESYATGRHCGGVVFDLEKAFNTLPRLVCLGLAALVGVDSGTTCAWAGALRDMTRCFVVRGSVSLPVSSTCGFAEGCGMSCLSMLLLDQLWHEWVRCSTELSKPLSYVDNWEIIVQDPLLIDVVVQATFDLAQQLDLVVDRKKSFTWATSGSFRRCLRTQGFRVCLDTADLGAHVTYSRQLRNSSLVARFTGLSDFWVKLKSAFGCHSQKAQVVLRAAWPRAMHAVSASPVGLKHFHSLRSAFMTALRLDRPGANSFAQLHSDGFLMDPHAFALLQTFRDHRDLATSSWHNQVLADLVHGGLVLPVGSVTQVLLGRIHVLKWSVLPNGLIQDALGAFSLSTLHWSELCLRFQIAWHHRVADALSHRSEFQGFEHVDAMQTRQVLGRLNAYQQGICRCNLNGSTLTNQHAYHWSASGSTTCKHCQQPDSLQHRYWECPHSDDLRACVDPIILDLVPLLPRACSIRSWQLRSPLVVPWWTYLSSLPSVFPPPAVSLEGKGPIDFFTDGSCLNQACRTSRVAAWAVCLAIPFEATVNAGMDQSCVVASAPLSGMIQTAFRAELTAVCAALHYACGLARPVRIWTDCLGVLRKFYGVVAGHGSIRINSANADLWLRVVELSHHIGIGNIQLIKVAAHQQLSSQATDLERWIHVHNAAVDGAARWANVSRPRSIWDLWEALVLQTDGLQNVCKQVLAHQLRVCLRWNLDTDVVQVVPPPRSPRT